MGLFRRLWAFLTTIFEAGVSVDKEADMDGKVAIIGIGQDRQAKLLELARQAAITPPGRKRRPRRFVSPTKEWRDMPKWQPCPTCRHEAKRTAKTLGGAHYHCPTHGTFLVKGRR